MRVGRSSKGLPLQKMVMKQGRDITNRCRGSISTADGDPLFAAIRGLSQARFGLCGVAKAAPDPFLGRLANTVCNVFLEKSLRQTCI
jgi:hypothetical protein